MGIEVLIQLKQSNNKRASLRATCILMYLKDGYSTTKISKEMGISQRSVQRYIRDFQQNGINRIQQENRGRKRLIIPEDISKLIEESPLKYDFILNKWLPSMLQTQTGSSSYLECNKVLFEHYKENPSKSVEALSTDLKGLRKHLELHSLADSVWLVHGFKLGNDRGKRGTVNVHYLIDYYCFFAINLNHYSEGDNCQEDEPTESLSKKPYLFSISPFSRSAKNSLQRETNFRELYASFFHNIIEYSFENFEHSMHLLLLPTQKNKSVLYRFRISEKYKSTDKPRVEAHFLNSNLKNGYKHLQYLESELKRDFSGIRTIDEPSIDALHRRAEKEICLIAPELTTLFRK
ncbi:helix-turn-helix domain-containing protein [Paenibacillus rhizophilus]|nr:helix-turn-helix domain-containing protein [Paenibacillus rhizophilus]